MSSVATSSLIGQSSSIIPSQVMISNVEGTNETVIQKGHKKSQEYESDTESDTTSDDDDTSDDDKRLADNPILKERLKQLDRYATPIRHHTHSPVQINDQHALNLYATGMSTSDTMQPNCPVSIHGMSSGSFEVIDSSPTPPEYRSRQLSAVQSPSCSGPASLNASVTPKHNLSPSCANISISGPIQQHEIDISDTYSHLSTTLPTKSCGLLPAYKFGASYNSSDVIHPDDIYPEDTEDSEDCVCKVCHIAYANRSSLRSHMKKHINHSIKRHQCDKCPYSTQYGKNLFKHIASMHTIDSSQELRCEGCCRCFPSETLLRDHDCILTQCNTYRCNECGRAFKTKLRLKYHADVHNPRKPYVCDVDGCDRAFRTPKYLKNHRDEFHRMHPKNYMCPVEQCDFVFHRKTHLKRHIATHDDAEKKYQCQWPNCQRRFCSEETLNLHHRKHTGEKPFSCALCLYNCYDKSSLNEHYQVHHAKDANTDYSFKEIHHQGPLSCSSQRPQETLAYKGPFTDRTLVTRTSTPVPTLSHRMADILGSCNSQVPGPLDAEIDGILNSLDEESDLPDLFSNEGFKTDHRIIERKFVGNSNHNLNSLVSPCCQNSQSSCLTAFTPVFSFSSITTESETAESSMSSVLPNIISELQRAELSGSSEEFEKVKSHVLSLLPKFVIGGKLTVQINEIVDEVNDALVGQPLSVIRAAFHTARPFTCEESYMIGSLEQQLLSESSLIAPNPPRRRGRRPKLQQQLQPYLQRIFGLESGAAESMASQLVNDSQKEKRTNYYGYYRSPVFRRGRISRGRGRSSKHFQSETPYDKSFLRTSNSNHSQYDLSAVSMCVDSIAGKHLGSGNNERYNIERMSDDIHTNFFGEINSHRNLTKQHNAHSEIIDNLKRANGFHAIHSQVHSEDYSYATKRFDCAPETNNLGMVTKSQSSDGESNENTKNNIPTSRYTHHQNRSASTQKDNRIRRYMTKESMFKSERITRLHDPYSEKEFLNQETLGEMLEDLGIIVQRIGERTVAKEHQNYLDSQPLNLSDFVHSEQVSGSANSQPIFSRSETNSQSIQLPSMSAVAPSSVGTPPSAEESTTGCVSNAEPQVLSPHLSTVSLRAPSSLKQSYPYNQSGAPISATDNLFSGKLSTIISSASHKSEQITYDSASNNYHRVAPMWSCESMCCPLTRDDEINKAEKSCLDNDYSSQVSQTRISESTRNYSKEINGDMSQCFYPKDLSTRMLSFGDRFDSSHQSSTSPKAFIRPEPTDSEFTGMRSESLGSYPGRLSSKASAMSSFISAAEAVDHLRSLSALGAKYTASVGVSKVGQYQPYHHSRPGDYSYNNVQVHPDGLPHSESATSHRSHNSVLIPTPNAFCANIPSLNTFFYRGRKSNEYFHSFYGLTSNESTCGNPVITGSTSITSTSINPNDNNGESLPTIKSTSFGNYINSNAFSNLNDYSSAAAAAAAYHQLSRCPTSSNPYNADNRLELTEQNNNYSNNPTSSLSLTHSSVTSSASPSISVHSSLRELYRNHNQQQPIIRPPVQELTTRQLLSEAAATAYAHGLGRCDGQPLSELAVTSMMQDDHPENLRHAQFDSTGLLCPQNQFRHHSTENTHSSTQLPVSSSNRLLNECMLPSINSNNKSSSSEYSNTNYLEHNSGATSLRDSNYPSHLRQTTPHVMQNALSRSMEQSQQSNTASQLVHSINEVSNLAAAEAAAAAAYAYHQYQQQQVQAINRQNLVVPQPPSAHSNYQNFFSQTNRRLYNPGQLDEQLTPQGDLNLCNNAHSERRDLKAACLPETYRNAQVTPGRFLF
ncbi:hypothetical protein MN116_005944 [Schistosoma mekongi]|uniref:C2H2-type domain-containing protein n=1 Tax=Schistosoma mekongi TaxID=38744 RepID=A0AAE1ZBG7_SCHME|nr:hypothetical protein MN116_005944 [Schistosoma mekongi]